MNIRIFRSIAIVVILSLALFAVIGCEDGVNMTSSVIGGGEPPEAVVQEPTGSGGTPGPELLAVGKMKQPVETDQIVEEPSDTVSPTVVDVGFYRDWQLMHKLTMADAVYPGDTVYITVVFSEPVRHSVADDETARPALSFVLDGQITRFRVAAHGAHGEDFFSGVCKPLHGNVSSYLCKVTVPDISGTLALQVGTGTVDRAGNPVAEATIHTAPFMVEMEMVMPVHKPPMAEESGQTSQEKAESVVRMVRDRIQAEIWDAQIQGEERERMEDEIYLEECGFDTTFIREVLLQIHLEENPGENFQGYFNEDLAIEYLRLTFEHEGAGTEEILAFFRESARSGGTNIDIKKSVFLRREMDENSRKRQVVPDILLIRESVFNREIEALKQKKKDLTFDISAELEEVFTEEAGLSFDFVHNTLLRIHLEENPDEQRAVDSGIYLHHSLISGYLFHRRAFEEESERQILERFRKFSSDGNTSITLSVPLHVL